MPENDIASSKEDLSILKYGKEQRNNALVSLGVEPISTQESSSQYDQGFVIPEENSHQALMENRAQRQGRFAKLGAGLVNTATSLPLDIIKDASYLLDTENYTNLEKSAQNGFHNWAEQLIQATEDKLHLSIYRTEDSKGFNPWSSGWWADNMPSIASSVSMAFPAEAAIKGLGALGELIGGNKLIEGISKAVSATGSASEIATTANTLKNTFKGVGAAVISRHMESLMEGSQTFESTYQEALKHGKTDEEAKVIAGEAASNNYKANWAALIQDIPEYMLLHKTFKESSSMFSKEGLKEAIKIAGIEGSEEGYQFITDKEAQRSALINHKVLPQDNTSLEDRLVKYAQDGDFWTSAFFGAIGGAGFGAYGVHKDNKAQKNYDGLLQMHKGILQSDPEGYYRGADEELLQHITTLTEDNNLEKYKQGLKNILDNPERIKDEDRVEKTKRTQEAIQQIEYAQKIHTEVMNDNSLSDDLKKATFGNKVDQKLTEGRLQEINTKILPIQAKESVLLGISPEVASYKEALLTYEGIKDIPVLKNKTKEYSDVIKQVGPILAKDSNQSIQDLNKSLSTSNDLELKKLFTNKIIEKDVLDQIKNINSKLSTPEGAQEFQDKVNKVKLEQDIKSFVQKKFKGEPTNSLEDLQFYDNNKQEIEKQLKDLKTEKDKQEQDSNTQTQEEKDQEQTLVKEDLLKENELKKQKIQLEKQDQIEQLKQRLSKQKELEQTFNNVKELRFLSPDSRVKYRGMQGRVHLHSEENVYIFEDENTGKQYDIPQDEKHGYYGKLYDYGIFELSKDNPVTDLIDIQDDGSITLNGKTYTNNYSNPLAAINRDSNDNILSVTLSTPEGKPRTFKKYADEIAYAIILHTYTQLEDEDQSIRAEITQRLDTTDERSKSERKEQTSSPEDTRESEKIEQAIANLEQGIKEAHEKLNEQLEAIFTKLDEIPIEEVELETTVNEFLGSINKRADSDDPAKKSNIWSTNNGRDNDKKKSVTIGYEERENIVLDGHKLLVVTRTTNSKLYQEILDQNPDAKAFEEDYFNGIINGKGEVKKESYPDGKVTKGVNYSGIYTILVDKTNTPIIKKGYYISSTLEQASRIDDDWVQVYRGLEDPEEIKQVIEQGKKDITNKRTEILNLKEGEQKYLNINGKSKGISIGSEGHSAFERLINGVRQSKNILGRIFSKNKEYKNIQLYLPTFTDEWYGTKVQLGKLYTLSEDQRVFDLVPRLLQDKEVNLILDLIKKRLDTTDSSYDQEIKKIIAFHPNLHPEYKIFINSENRLEFGNQEIDKDEFDSNKENIRKFLETKRTNVNSKLLGQNRIQRPSLNKDGEEVDYKEYLLGGDPETGVNPMFGTDLKTIENTQGKPKRRFLNTYFTYDPELVSGEQNTPDVQQQNTTLEDNEAPIITKLPPIKEFKLPGLGRIFDNFKDKVKLNQSERDWFNKVLPNQDIERIHALIYNRYLAYYLSSGKLLLSDEATVGTLYHEAFHITTQQYLTKDEIDKLYKEAGEKYKGKSREELEEILAEDFYHYKSTGKVLNQRPLRNTIFRRLLNFIRDLLKLSSNDIQSIYERLDKGYYTDKPIVGIREFSSLGRDEDTKRVLREKGTVFTNDTINSINLEFFKEVFSRGNTPLNIGDTSEILNKLFKNIFLPKYKELHFQNNLLALEYEYILENWSTFIKMFQKKLDNFGAQLKIKKENTSQEDKSLNIEEEEVIKKGAEKYFQEANIVSTLETISSPTRVLIQSLTKVNSKGEPILNSLKREQTVDFGNTYGYLIKNLSGTGPDYSTLYSKLIQLSKYKPELKELYQRLGPPSGDISNEKIDFQSTFLQDFNKTRTTSIITIYDSDGNIRTIDSIRANEAERVKTQWEANLREVTKTDSQGRLILQKYEPNLKSINFLRSIGIKFDTSTLNIVNSPLYDKTQIDEAAKAIKEYIQYYKNDLTNLYNPGKDQSAEDKKVDVQGRLKYLQELDALYTSQVNESSSMNAEGETIYAIGDNNSLSITINAINRAKSLQELYRDYSHLNTISTQGSLWMKELFDSKGNKNQGVQLILETHSGIKTAKEQDKDVIQMSTRKETLGDLSTQQIVNILKGKSSWLVSSDKSTEFIVYLKNYNGSKELPIPIEDFKTGFDIHKLKSIFRDYFKNECTKIALFQLQGTGTNIDKYQDSGNEFVIFQDILVKNSDKELHVKTDFNNFIEDLKQSKKTYQESKEDINKFIDTLLPKVDIQIQDFFEKYFKEQKNFFTKEKITEQAGFPKELLEKKNSDGSFGSTDQLIRALIVTDFINSVEQTKLFSGDLSFYSDPYKRFSMFAGTKSQPRVDKEIDSHLNKLHKRKDLKPANGKENIQIILDPVVQKQDLKDWIKAFQDKEISDEEAYSILGYKYNPETQEVLSNKGYSKYEESDAFAGCSLDFYKEFYKRLMGSEFSWTLKHEIAYQIIQRQEFDTKGNLIKGELLKQDQIALFPALKAQYSGPTWGHNSEGLFVPLGLKFTIMPYIPQAIAGKNASIRLQQMIKNQVGISVFKSGAKFGTIFGPNGSNKAYTEGNHGEVNTQELYKSLQQIDYKYLGLQVKPSPPHNTNTFSTQFRKTTWIGAFENGEPVKEFPEAKQRFDDFNDLIAQRTEISKQKLIKELGFSKDINLKDATKLVQLLTKAAKSRNLTSNIIDSLDIEKAITDGKEILDLKYKVDSMIGKARIDSMLTALVNSNLVTHKFNGDNYVLAPVTYMEKIGIRPIGTNPALRGYERDPRTGKTFPAETKIAMSENYYPLLNRYGSLKELNAAVKRSNEAMRQGKPMELDREVLELIGCRIPGQGMNSNEYLIIEEFLPEDSSTSMFVNDQVVKAGIDFDNDKTFTYRPNLDKNGRYLKDNLDNKIIQVLKDVISHSHNFTSLITPNSTNIIENLVNKVKHIQYQNKGGKLGLEEYINQQEVTKPKNNFTESIKLFKKIQARYKLWLFKDLVGSGAIVNAFGPLAQIANLHANKEYLSLDTIQGNKDLGEKSYQAWIKHDTIMNLPHNKTPEGLINLAAQKDSFGRHDISEIRNQKLNAKVDAAKKEIPFLSYININSDTDGAANWLDQIGVPFEISSLFMSQPVITKYLELNGTNKSTFLKVKGLNNPYGVNQDILQELEAKVFPIFGLEVNKFKKREKREQDKEEFFKLLSERRAKTHQGENPLELTEQELTDALKIENQDTEEFNLLEYQVFNDFLEYKKQAQVFLGYLRMINSDTNGLDKNLDASFLRDEDDQKTTKSGLINGIERILEDTFIKSFRHDSLAIKMFEGLYHTHTQEIDTMVLDLAQDVINNQENFFISKDDKLNLVTTIRNDFINYILQNYSPEFKDKITQVRKDLFKGPDSIAKELLKLKNLDNPNKEQQKILNLQVIQELFPLIDKAKPGSDYDNIKLFTKRLDTQVSDQLTDSFRELRLLDPQLYDKIIKLGILQSGLNNSPITYLGIIPFEDYNQRVKEAFKEFNKKNEEEQKEDLQIFSQLFKRERNPNKGYGMYGKQFDKTKKLLPGSNTIVPNIKDISEFQNPENIQKSKEETPDNQENTTPKPNPPPQTPGSFNLNDLLGNKLIGDIDPNITKFFPTSTVKSVNILKQIANSDHPLNRLARRLLSYAKFNNINIELVDTPKFKNIGANSIDASGYYDPNTNEIKIAKGGFFRNGNSIPTLLEEVLHSLAWEQINSDTEVKRDFNKLYEYAKEKLKDKNHYHLMNLQEFFAGIFKNPELIQDMIDTPALPGATKYRNFLQQIYDYIISLFKIKKGDSLYEQAFSTASQILEDFKDRGVSNELSSNAELLGSKNEEENPNVLNIQSTNLQALMDGKKTSSLRATSDNHFKEDQVLNIHVKKIDTGIRVKVNSIKTIPDFTKLTPEEKDQIVQSLGDYKNYQDFITSDEYVKDNSTLHYDFPDVYKFIKGEISGDIISYTQVEETKEDKILKDLHTKQLESLKNRRKELSGEADPIRRTEISKRMDIISASINKLQQEMSYDNVIKVSMRDLKEISNLDMKNLSDKDFNFVKNTLDRLIEVYDYIPNSKITEENKAKLNHIRSSTKDLLEQYKEASIALIDRITTSEGKKSTLEDLVNPTKDILMGKRLFLGLDTTHIPILRLMDSMFETIKRKTQTVMSDFNQEFDQIKKKYSKKENFNKILDSRGRLITSTKGEYFDREREMLQRTATDLEDPSLSKKEKAKIFQERDEWYISNNNYELTPEGEKLFNERLQTLRNDLTNEDGEVDQEDLLYIDKWEIQNSPILGLKYIEEGEKSIGNYYWYRYLKQTPKEKWNNLEFNKIKDNELYKFVTKTIEEGLKKIPHRMIVDLGSFNKVLNSIIFDFNQDQMFLKSAWSDIEDFMSSTFKTEISKEQLDGYSGNITDEKGKDKPKLYPKSITEIQKERHFKNPLDIIKEFYNTAVSYEHKTQIEPNIWLLKDLLDKQSAIKTNKQEIVIKDTQGNPKLIENGLENAKSLAMTNILSELYDKRRLDTEDNIPTEKEKREFDKKYKQWLEDKKVAAFNGDPIPEEPTLKKLSGVKVLDAVVDFTRANLLWWKPLSAINNLLIGIENNFLHASRRTDFNDQEAFEALKILGNSITRYISFGKVDSEIAQKIKALSTLMGIDTETFTEDQQTYLSKIAKYGLSWQTSGEYLIANQIMIAKMLNTKVTNLKGEQTSLWKAFDLKGKFNTQEYGEELNLKEFKDRIREVRKQTQGDYQSAMQFKSKVSGRVLMLFRTWLPRAIHNRFGEQIGDNFKGRYLTYRDVYQSYTENNGFWKGIGKLAGRQVLSVLTKVANIPGISQLGGKSLAELCESKYEEELKKMGLSDLDIQNMRVNVRELQHMVYISLIVLALGAMGGDDDKDRNFTINLGMRIYQDLSFFYSFNSATAITKDPIPIYKTIQDAYKLVGDSYNYVSNPSSDILKSSRNKGESKVSNDASRLFPGLSAYESTLNTMNRVFNNNKYK